MTWVHKIDGKTAVIGIVGLGYVGLPLMRRFLERGFSCVGIDIDPEKIARIEAGSSYIKHLNFDSFASALDHGRLLRLSSTREVVIEGSFPQTLSELEPNLQERENDLKQNRRFAKHFN